MSNVNYNNKTVSDENVKTVLQRVANQLKGDVNVFSGDRSAVPKGGSKTSHHLQGRAADFSVTGCTLQDVFANLKSKKSDIFDSDKKYQVIHHGSHTATGGAHIHIGRYASGSGVSFLIEGLTAKTKGIYTSE